MTIRSTAMRALRLGSAAVALAAIAWLAWCGAASWDLRRAEHEARQAGLPMSAAEIFPRAIPDDDNAAPLWARIEELAKTLKAKDGYLAPCPGASSAKSDPARFDDARVAELRRQMAWPEVQEILRLTREASAKPAAAFRRDASGGYVAHLEGKGIAGPLDAARLAGTSAWLKAKDGDQAGAVADLASCSKAASLEIKDPTMISWLVGAGVDTLSAQMAQQVIAALPDGTFRAADWNPLREQWARNASEARANLVRALDGERLFFADYAFDAILREGTSLRDLAGALDEQTTRNLQLFYLAYRYPLRPLFIMDRTCYLRFMMRVRDEAKNLVPGALGGDPLESIPRTAIITRLTAPAMEGVLGRLAKYLVQLQLAQSGLELEAFRAETGSYPQSLTALSLHPAAITDPFTGKPFAYEADRDSALLYSVGEDRADDGGNPRAINSRQDIVWQVNRDTEKPPAPTRE